MNKNALPFDINEFLGTSSAGFVAHPEGFYLLKVTEIGGGGYKNGPGSYTRFATEIQMGPGADTSREDRPFSDMIGNGDLATLDKATPKQKERMARDKAAYKQIWEACLGGEEACRDYLTQLAEAGSAADNEVLVGRKYIAYLTVSKDGTNNYIRTRIPFNDANWKYAVDNTPGEEAATTAGGVVHRVLPVGIERGCGSGCSCWSRPC